MIVNCGPIKAIVCDFCLTMYSACTKSKSFTDSVNLTVDMAGNLYTITSDISTSGSVSHICRHCQSNISKLQDLVSRNKQKQIYLKR